MKKTKFYKKKIVRDLIILCGVLLIINIFVVVTKKVLKKKELENILARKRFEQMQIKQEKEKNEDIRVKKNIYFLEEELNFAVNENINFEIEQKDMYNLRKQRLIDKNINKVKQNKILEFAIEFEEKELYFLNNINLKLQQRGE